MQRIPLTTQTTAQAQELLHALPWSTLWSLNRPFGDWYLYAVGLYPDVKQIHELNLN